MSEPGPACVDCATASPETNTDYTLISQTGWRLTRAQRADGAPILEWRCPKCWNKRKAARSG